MTPEYKRKFIREKLRQIEEKANICNFFYCACFWMSNVTDQLEYRVGYFEDFCEAAMFEGYLKQEYRSFPYYVSSNMTSADTNKGLF